MLRLKDRQRQIPNGIFFYVPQTKWRSRPGSFSNVVQQVQAHLRGNPLVAKQLNWQTDTTYVENLVDNFNARVCEKMGWGDYYIDSTGTGVSLPKSLPRNNPEWSPKLAVVAGANTLRDWFGAGMVPVSVEIAHSRAAACADCPMNTANKEFAASTEQGDWTQYFTKPAADFIKKQLEKRQELKLFTPHDEKLDMCHACLCPLKLKVWTPIQHIRARMPEPVKQELHANCWVLKEA